LSSIAFHGGHHNACTRAFHSFVEQGGLRQFPNLRELPISKRIYGAPVIRNLQILFDAAVHPNLEKLHVHTGLPFRDKMDTKLLQLLQSPSENPLFPNLKSVILHHLPLSIYNALVQRMPSLVNIEICGMILDAPYIQIPSSPVLESLDIRICSCYHRINRFPQPPLVTASWLMDIAHSKPSLRHLEINTKDNTTEWIARDALNDEMIDEFATLLPRLEILFLDRDVKIDDEVVIQMGPKLTQIVEEKWPDARFVLFGTDSKDAWISKEERTNPTFWRFVRDLQNTRGLCMPRHALRRMRWGV
jgi:hypothetical protein